MPRDADSPEAVRHKNLFPAAIRESVQPLMFGHPDYSKPCWTRDENANASLQSGLIRKDLLGQRIVYDGQLLPEGVVSFRKRAAIQHAGMECLEISGQNGLDIHPPERVCRNLFGRPWNSIRRSHRIQWKPCCATDAFDAGNRAQAILQFAQKRQTPLRSNVFRIPNRQEREEAVGI